LKIFMNAPVVAQVAAPMTVLGRSGYQVSRLDVEDAG
jgi:hypothetical protein